jgi:hypothetical protein
MDQRGEPFQELRANHPAVRLLGEEPDEIRVRVRKLPAKRTFNVRRILEARRRFANSVWGEPVPGELLHLFHGCRVDVLQVELQERTVVHPVRLVDVGVEPVFGPVRQDAEPGRGNPEIPEQLPGMPVQVLRPGFALYKNLRFPGDAERVVDFLALLHSHIAGHFRDDLRGIEYVVSESLQERKDEGRLGGFLAPDGVPDRPEFFGQRLQRIDKVHRVLLVSRKYRPRQPGKIEDK